MSVHTYTYIYTHTHICTHIHMHVDIIDVCVCMYIPKAINKFQILRLEKSFLVILEQGFLRDCQAEKVVLLA